MAEAKVLRAYFYYKLNIMYKGVPVYLEPVEASGVHQRAGNRSRCMAGY